MTTVFLAGASGFLGAHWLRGLCATGCTFKALSRRAESDAAIRAQGGVPMRAELTDRVSLQAALFGCTAVFHATADTSIWGRHADAQSATHIAGTTNLLRTSEVAAVQALMHTSPVSAWSRLVHERIDESTLQRGGESRVNHNRSKLPGEQVVRHAALPWIVFNPTHILGPGDHRNGAHLIALVGRRKLPGIAPGVGGFADAREIARTQVRAWQRQRFGQTHRLGGEQASFVDLVHRIRAPLGKRTPRGATPARALIAFARLANA
ncbi:MAG: NAD-dependent epimerase/dehydratase family protein [Rhodanobacter sp.]